MATTDLNWNTVKSWKINGKISIVTPEQKGSGRFTYEENQQSKIAQFNAALGQGSWKIVESENGAELFSSKAGTTKSSNLEELILTEFGWDFPWNELSYWVRGYKESQPLTPHAKQIEPISDLDWRIKFTKLMPTEIGSLPKSIQAQNPPYKIKLVIYDWEFE